MLLCNIVFGRSINKDIGGEHVRKTKLDNETAAAITFHSSLTGKAGKTPCIACPLRKVTVFREFTKSELEFVSKFKDSDLHLKSGETLMMEGQSSQTLYTLLSGWMYRYKDLPDGRRQVLNFVLPGDFVGLQAAVFGEAQHTIECLTDTVLCVFPRTKLWTLYENEPGLGFDVTWLAAREEKMLDDNLLSIGRRSAAERLAFILNHLLRRLRELGLVSGAAFETPFNQQHLADTLGLSLVHTNKTIRKLTQQGLISWKDKTLAVLDEGKLANLAKYDRESKVKRPLI
jgi:CRP/FNR family transcriptional regulator, anaerobic regulatory protein